MKRDVQIAVVLAAAMLIGGCAGIPISTMWKMHSFGPADFSALDGGYIRAAVRLPVGTALKNDVTTLAIALTRQNGQIEKLSMPVQQIADGQQVDPSLESAGIGKHWLLFALTDQGKMVFQTLQIDMRNHKTEYTGVSISLNFELAEPPNSSTELPRNIPLELWLRLRQTDGFIELFEGRLKFEPEQKRGG